MLSSSLIYSWARQHAWVGQLKLVVSETCLGHRSLWSALGSLSWPSIARNAFMYQSSVCVFAWAPHCCATTEEAQRLHVLVPRLHLRELDFVAVPILLNCLPEEDNTPIVKRLR